jgi:hypothetical protein
MELEKSSEQVLPEREGGEVQGVEMGAGGEVTQTMYAHVNK